MVKFSDEDRSDVRMVVGIFVEPLVRDGQIRLVGRSDREVMADIISAVAWLRDQPLEEYKLEVDHQGDLLREATRYREMAQFNFALMFYATWFEHWLNGMFVWCASHKDGLEREDIIQLIRVEKVHNKVGRTWRRFFGDGLPFDAVKTISKVADARNDFIHYKWPEQGINEPVEDEQNRLRELVTDAAATVSELLRVEDRLAFENSRVRLNRLLDELYLN